MASIQTSKVVAYSVQIVNGFFIAFQQIVGQVKSLYREIDKFLYFPRTEKGSSLMRKTLEMDNQEFGGPVQFHFLKRVLMVFTA